MDVQREDHGARVLVGGDRDAGGIVDALADGRGVLVVGALGAGKTFLVDRVVEAAGARGLDPLVLRGAAPLAAVPHGAIDDRTVRRLRAATPDAPVHVVVDDVEHLDDATVQLLVRGVVRGAARCVLAASPGRVEEATRAAAVRGQVVDLWLADRLDRLDLRDPDADEAAALVDAFAGARLDAVTRDVLVARARGSRRLLRELVGVAVRASAGGADPLDLPTDLTRTPGLRDALAAETVVDGPATREGLVVLRHLPGVPYADACLLLGARQVDALVARRLVTVDDAADRALHVALLPALLAEDELGDDQVERLLADVEERVAHDGAVGDVLAELVVARASLRSAHATWTALDPARRTRLTVGASRQAQRGGRHERALAWTRLPGLVPDDPELLLERVAALVGLREVDRARSELSRVDLAQLSGPAAARAARCWAELVRPSSDGTEAALAGLPPDLRAAGRAELDLLRAERAALAADWAQAALLARRALDGTPHRRTAVRAAGTACLAFTLLGATDGARSAARAATALLHAPVVGRAVPLPDALASGCALVVAHVLHGVGPAAPPDDLDEVVAWARAAAPTAAAAGPDALAPLHVVHACLAVVRGDGDAVATELATARARLPRGARGAVRSLLAWAHAAALATTGDVVGARRAGADADERHRAHAVVDVVALLAEAFSGADGADAGRLRAAVRGAPPLERLVDGVLGAAAPGVPTPRPAGRVVTRTAIEDALSDRELEVALLVGEGMTNRAVAERLVLSVRTVESHVYQACRKLDVPSRRDLGRLVAASGATHAGSDGRSWRTAVPV